MYDIFLVLDTTYLVLFSRTVIGLLFLAAGISKIAHRRAFILTIRKYQILPKVGSQIVGNILPWIEIIVAIAIFFGMFMPWSALVAILLLGIFISAVTFNILRGNRNISCGCFGTNNDTYLGWSIVARNVLLIILTFITIGPANLDRSQEIAATLPLIRQLPIEEVIATIAAASATLALWWFWSILSNLWSPPKEEYPANT